MERIVRQILPETAHQLEQLLAGAVGGQRIAHADLVEARRQGRKPAGNRASAAPERLSPLPDPHDHLAHLNVLLVFGKLDEVADARNHALPRAHNLPIATTLCRASRGQS